MLTFMQLKASKAKRSELTQKQRAQIVDIQVARKLVREAIEGALAVRHTTAGLYGEDLDRIFTNQPVHFDELGYVPHWFKRSYIASWGIRICRERYKSEYERKKD